MIAIVIAGFAALALVVLITIELLRPHSNVPAPRVPRRERRVPALEERIGVALQGPQHRYGILFHHYSVWRGERGTRLQLLSASGWPKLSTFTRCLIVRYLWRVLEGVAAPAMVVVDLPPLQWTAEINAGFNDKGADPWSMKPRLLARPLGPQFVKE
jgi:hypothetical protein